jgi:alpha-tubulin suppressor-like RCC1 family protein
MKINVFSSNLPRLINAIAFRFLILAIGLLMSEVQPLIAAEPNHDAATVRSVALVDSALLASIPREEFVGSRVIPIDGNRDVIEQITAALDGQTDIDVVRVLSHGEHGALCFGAQKIDAAMLDARSRQISDWKNSLSANAEILLYGCSVAGTNQGKLFVNRLASLTDANVAASTNPTGRGGNTILEYAVGLPAAGLMASQAEYERAGIQLGWTTWNHRLTFNFNNQDGTAHVTLMFDVDGDYHYGDGTPNGRTDYGPLYLYVNNVRVATKDFSDGKDRFFTGNYALRPGVNVFRVSKWKSSAYWSNDPPATYEVVAPYFYGAPAAATAHTAAVGSSFSYYYYAAGTGPVLFTATGLPAGLTMNSGGVISGYPRSGSAGVYQANIRASNGFGTKDLPVTFTITNQAPGFASTTPAVLTGGIENTPLTITYASLAAAVGATDPNNTNTAMYYGWAIDPISFRIESVLGGTLTKNGSPVTAGSTLVGAGDSLVWTPSTSASGSLDAFTVVAYDGALYSAATKTVKVSIGAINDAPTLTSFSGPVTAGTEDSSIPITFADLVAKGDEADIDSAVTGFVVNEVTTGSLKIGATEGTATPWDGPTNKVITASLIGYWTPDPNANGPQSALKVVARDDAPLESATPVQAVVSVTPSTDAPTLTAVDIISGQTEGEPMEISYTSIAAAADEADVDGDVISFRIEAVSSGTLQKWSSSAWAAVVPGTTLIAAGEKLRWTPTIGTTGLQNAFTIKAWDGQFASATVVQMKIDASRWTIVPWTSAATSGLDPRYRYTHAYSFGASGSFALGGITFTGIAGGNPSVEGKLATTNFGSFTANDDNNLSDASRSLANDFVYGSSAVQTVTLRGLIPGTRYVLSLFSVGADSTSRDFTLQGAMGQVAVNQNEFGNNNGIRIDYKYLADSSGAATITITPASGSFNLYGIANRESSPSATLYPPSSLTYDGSPKNFQSGIAPRNEPFVSAGVLHSVVLKSDGTVSAFGTNDAGQTNVPAGLNNVVAVSAGGYHTLALKSDGTVVAWGSNHQGQSTIPAGLSGVVAISAGKVHNLALKSNGTVVAWGSNSGGQTTVPAGLTGVVAISAGASHSMALKSDGTVVAWGVGFYNYATPPANLTDVVAISAGEWHSLALKSDGTVVAWGNNSSFQSEVPSGLKGVVAISAGASHSVAVKSDGTVVAWGDRDNYGLINIPAGLAEVVAIDAGPEHTIALKADGTVVSFGWFRYGQNSPPASEQFPAVGLPGRSYTFNATYAYSYEGRGATTYAASSTAPTNAGDYTVTAIGNGATITQNFTIQKVTPTLSYLNRLNSVPYGTALNSNHVDSTSCYWWNQGTYTTIPGTKVYSPAIGAILPVGNHPLSVTFLPTDSVNFNPAVAYAAGALTVTKTTNVSENIVLPSLTDLTFNGLAKTHTATATGVAGFTYTYTGRAGTSYGPSSTAPTYAGSYTITATVNDVNYTGAKSLDFAIAKATPTITTNPTAAAITYGQSLASSALTGGAASVRGTFSFATPGTTPSVGSTSHTVIFTPADTLNYNTTSGSASVTVNAATLNSASIAFTPPASLIYSGSAKTFTATAPGISTDFAYSYSGISGTNYGPTTTAPTNAGNYAVTATVTSANYTGSATQTFTIAKITPAITWATPASIAYYTALSATQLNATANAAGSFAYTPNTGAVLGVGAHALQAVFTPTDTTNYATVTASVPLQVTSPQLPIALRAAPNLTYDGTAKPYTVSQSAYLSAGAEHALVLKADGTVVAWGSNTAGQTTVPSGLTDVVQVAAGYDFSAAVKANGRVVAWGSYTLNDYITNLNQVTNAIAAAAGNAFIAVLRADGTVTSFGISVATQTLNVPAGLSGVAAIAAGGDHVLALKADGTVVAWGRNTYGQTTVPAGLSNVVAVAASADGDHSLALKADGTVVAWGDNSEGQCNIPAGLSGVVAITAGNINSYALKADGTVVGWGRADFIVVPSNVTGVAALAAGSQHAFAIKTDGTVAAWGRIKKDSRTDHIDAAPFVPSPLSGVGNFSFSYSYVGRAGTTYPASSSAPTNAGNYTLTVSSTLPNYSYGKTVDFTIAKATPTITTLPQASIITEGQALSASTLKDGAASLPGTFAFSTPSFVPSVGTTTQSITFTPTDSTNYASVTATVTVRSQGANAAIPNILSPPTAAPIAFGQRLQDSVLSGGGASVPGTFVFSSALTVPNPGTASQSVTFIPTDIVSYAAVTFFVPLTVTDGIVSPLNISLIPPTSLAYNGMPKGYRTARGSLLSCRNTNMLFVKSDGTVGAYPSISMPAGLTGVVAVAAGVGSYRALKSDGTVVEWGSTWQGTAPAGLNGVVAITSGDQHSLALKSNGTVVAWGLNTDGQRNVPADLSNVVAIAASSNASFALKSNGTVVAWGSNSYGQCDVPAGLSGVIAISAGSQGTVAALKSDGTVVCWGRNVDYSNNVSGQATVPTGLTNVVAVAVGDLHTVALKADGTVVAWGKDTTLGFFKANLVPYNLTDVVAISAGSYKTLALKSDGSVVWWGAAANTEQYTANGQPYVIYAITPLLTADSAGFAFSTTYTGRDGTTYAASVTPPTEPGDYTVTITGTDPDFAATKTIDFSITKGRPIILSTPFPSGISYGEMLDSYPLLEGTASVPGTFAFENPSTIPNAGDSMHNLVFTPADTDHYEPVTVAMEVRVSKATPSLVALPTATTATHGQALAELTLANGLASVSGTFTFNSVATVSAGTTRQTVTFTPDDTTNYNALTAELDVTVVPATPSILTSPTATPIAAGQALSSSTLNGGEASVEGTFTWENSNTAPDTGTTTQNFVFTPNDTTNYTSTTGTVSVTVNKATPTVTSPPIASAITFGQSLSNSTLDSGIASVAGTFAWTNPSTEPNAGTASHAFTFTPDDTTNYQATTGTVSVTVHKALASITLGNLNASYDGTAKSASVSTTPEGLTTILTYNGESTAPSDEGTYEVVATINDANFTGTKSELLTIAQTRLFGIGGDPLGQATSSVITLSGEPSIWGIACDGTRIYVNSSSSEIRVYDLNGTLLESHAVENLPPLGNNQMAFAGGHLFARNDDTLYRISTTDWSSTLVAVDSSHPMLTCAWWMYGSLFDTPDGKLGVMGPTIDGQFTVRLYQVSSDGLTLTWERDQVINDTWSTDEHGMACDGAYFYRMSMLDGCKVYDLQSGEIVHGGEGWNLWSAADGGTIENPTWLTRNHRTGQLIAGDFQADHLLVFTPDDGINFTAPQSMVYDGSGKVFSASSTVPCTFEYTYTGIGITSYGPSTEAPKNAGNYVVTASSTDSSPEGSSSLPFTIVPKTLTVTSDAKTKIYGAVDPALTYQSSGLVGADEITGSLNRAPGENAGSYSILPGSITAGANYEISYTGANLVVEKAPIAPTNFLAAQTTNLTADLSWTPDSTQNSACTGFKISHKPSASDTWTENTVGADASTYSVSSLLPGTVYNFRIAALNGTDSSSVVTTTITTWTSREEWRFTNFGTTTGSGNAADNASPSGDGMPNLVKYALGLNANARSTSATLNTQINANRRLTLTFMRARTELTYTVQGSDDLETWSKLIDNPGSVGETVTVTDTKTAPARFLRLKVSD